MWRRHRTIIIHPGPIGDRGPWSLDRVITTGEIRWGVTALQAVEEMDAGPIWGSRTAPIADAAIDLIGAVVVRATDPTFTPEPLDYRRRDSTETILRGPGLRQSASSSMV